jgi:hypothetical protein
MKFERLRDDGNVENESNLMVDLLPGLDNVCREIGLLLLNVNKK